ncbi:hypothetical protein V7S43_007394 [Phytophthora oleae]|uniref:PiggyBac transposable element-derived protein domain-containing protein n=1 Tax=Phytophthora oleae TaxID=2107226 RepID=A0ABD3FNG1_9STRA
MGKQGKKKQGRRVQEKQQEKRVDADRRARLRPHQHVDYVAATLGFAKDDLNDDDYVDDPLASTHDVAQEDEDMASLEEEDPRVLDNDTKTIDQEVEAQNEIAPGNDEKCDGDTADDGAEVHANVSANIAYWRKVCRRPNFNLRRHNETQWKQRSRSSSTGTIMFYTRNINVLLTMLL